MAVRQAVGGYVVEAVIESDLPWIESPQSGQQWATNVLIVADDFPENAFGPNGRRVEIGDNRIRSPPMPKRKAESRTTPAPTTC